MARRKEPAPVCCSHWRVVTSGQLQMVASRSRVSGSIRRRGFFMFQLAARCRAALPVRLDAHRPGSVVYVVVRLKNVQTCQRSCGRQLLHTNPNSCACTSVHVVNRPGPPGELPLLWPSARLAPLGRERTKLRSNGAESRTSRTQDGSSHSKTCSRNSGEACHFGLPTPTPPSNPPTAIQAGLVG